MDKYTVTFKQVDDQGFVRSTTATTKDGYFSALGEPVTWGDIEWPKLHLVGDNLLPMHYEANLKYRWVGGAEDKDFAKGVRHYLSPETNSKITDEDLLRCRYESRDLNDFSWYILDHTWWVEFANKALDFLKEHDRTVVWVTDQPVFDEDSVWVEIEGYGKLPCEVSEQGGCIEVGTGDYEFMCFTDRDEAGQAAKAYWQGLAENDPREFAETVGTENLVAWELGNRAGPGTTKVSSLEEWFDLWLETPEEHWARYDGRECQVLSVSEAFKDEFRGLGVAYRSN